MYSIALELCQKLLSPLWYSGAQEERQYSQSSWSFSLGIGNLDVTNNSDMQSNNGYRRRHELQESLNAVDPSLTSFRYPFPTFTSLSPPY
jgi:hypothetical protein